EVDLPCRRSEWHGSFWPDSEVTVTHLARQLPLPTRSIAAVTNASERGDVDNRRHRQREHQMEPRLGSVHHASASSSSMLLAPPPPQTPRKFDRTQTGPAWSRNKRSARRSSIIRSATPLALWSFMTRRRGRRSRSISLSARSRGGCLAS